MKKTNWRSVFLLFVATCIVLCLTACKKDGNDNEIGSDKADTTTESIFATATTNPDTTVLEEITFEEANVFSFDLISRDDESYSDIISFFKATNTGKKPVDYLSIDYVYYDKDDNVICDDSRYVDFQIAPGKAVMSKTYSDLDDENDKSLIQTIRVPSYSYYIGETAYEVDVDSKQVKTRNHSVDADLDFEKANILSFEYDDKGLDSVNDYVVGIKVHNNGAKKVTYCSIDLAYLDAEGTCLDRDSRYNDSGFDTGKFATMKSYMTEEAFSKNVKSFGVYEYSYRFTEDDENGFNRYTVNLQTKEVSGYHSDY